MCLYKNIEQLLDAFFPKYNYILIIQNYRFLLIYTPSFTLPLIKRNGKLCFKLKIIITLSI